MTTREQLSARIRTLRRRQFGRSGKAEFARRLGVELAEYERYERGAIPPGELMVRMCEVTGEDLQWLLTGVAARGTVVITGARRRHQDLVARVAQLLDEQPTLAGPLEAFVALLEEGDAARRSRVAALPMPSAEELLAVHELDELPMSLGDPEGDGGGPGGAPLALPAQMEAQYAALLLEPGGDAAPDSREVAVVSGQAGGQLRMYVRSRGLATLFPDALAVRAADELMAPMFAAGDIAVVSRGQPARVGQPALCRRADGAALRIWLGRDGDDFVLGRLADHEQERVPAAALRWSLEVLYRVARAA